MDPRLVTSVLSVVAVLLSLAHGFPQESSAELLTKTEVSALDDAVKTSPIEKAGEKRESGERPKSEPSSSLASKLKVRFPLEDPKTASTSKEAEDDSVRSPRQSPSTSSRHGPHTTVCIQIHSDRPEVVCGPEVEQKKEDLPSARFAYPDYAYARASPQYPPYPQRYAQQLPPAPIPMRAPQAAISTPIYAARRREEEVVRPVEKIVQQPPLRVFQSPIPQQPVVLQRQVYQPVMSAGLYPQASQLLRLNCGVQPELSSSLLSRSSFGPMMGYYPVGEQLVTIQAGSSGLLGPGGFDTLLPREQSVFSSPLHARMSSEGQSYILNRESPYAYSTADPWASAGYMGEAGFMNMQGRSAGSGFEEQYSNSLGYPSESSMDETARRFLQEQELQQSRLRLRMLQNQLRELHQRSSADEALKGATATDPSHGQDTAPAHEQKKDQAGRTSKRHARAKDT